MKKGLLFVALMSTMSSTAFAEGVTVAKIEPKVIEAAAAASSVGAEVFVVMAALVVFAAAAGR